MQVCRALSRRRVHDRGESTRSPGPAIGRPKSATFRTVDIAGIDVLAHVAREPDRASAGSITRRVRAAAVRARDGARGWTGAKAGQGFYKKAGDGRDPHARSGDAGIPREAVRRACRRSRRRGPSTMPAGAHARLLFAARTRSGSSCATTLGADAGLRGAASPGDRPLDRRRRPRDALGIRLGARAVRDVGLRSASIACSRPPAAPTLRRCWTTHAGRAVSDPVGLKPAAPACSS